MKILVNIPTLHQEEIFPPWLRILKIFQSHGNGILINTGLFVKNLDVIVDVYGFDWLSEEEQIILSKGKTTTKMGFLFHSLKRNYLLLKNRSSLLQHNKFDVVYTPSSVLDFVIFPFILKRIKEKIKWATTLANIVPVTDPGNKIIRFLAWCFFRISFFMIGSADIIFASTPEIEKYLLSAGFPREKVILTGFGIEADLIAQAQPFNKYESDALFVGRINETKGIYDMLKILKIVTQKYPDFQLAIMGGGDKNTKSKLKREIRRENLEKNAQFLGYKNGMEKYNIIKSAKCFWFLSVSKSESFGVALLEAVCSGIPAFAYDLPQFSWLYPDGEVDITPKGNCKMVAEKVIGLFKRGNFSNEKGKKLLGKYSWEKIAEIEYNAMKKLFHNE